MALIYTSFLLFSTVFLNNSFVFLRYIYTAHMLTSWKSHPRSNVWRFHLVFYCSMDWRPSDIRTMESSMCLWGIKPINCQETGTFARKPFAQIWLAQWWWEICSKSSFDAWFVQLCIGASLLCWFDYYRLSSDWWSFLLKCHKGKEEGSGF